MRFIDFEGILPYQGEGEVEMEIKEVRRVRLLEGVDARDRRRQLHLMPPPARKPIARWIIWTGVTAFLTFCWLLGWWVNHPPQTPVNNEVELVNVGNGIEIPLQEYLAQTMPPPDTRIREGGEPGYDGWRVTTYWDKAPILSVWRENGSEYVYASDGIEQHCCNIVYLKHNQNSAEALASCRVDQIWESGWTRNRTVTFTLYVPDRYYSAVKDIVKGKTGTVVFR